MSSCTTSCPTSRVRQGCASFAALWRASATRRHSLRIATAAATRQLRRSALLWPAIGVRSTYSPSVKRWTFTTSTKPRSPRAMLESSRYWLGCGPHRKGRLADCLPRGTETIRLMLPPLTHGRFCILCLVSTSRRFTGLGPRWCSNWLANAAPICRLGRMPSTSPPGSAWHQATDFRWEGPVIPYGTFGKSGCGIAATGRGDGRPYTDRIGGILPPAIGADRQGQGGHRNGEKDCRAILQCRASRNGLCRSRSLILRRTIQSAGSGKPSPSCHELGFRSPGGTLLGIDVSQEGCGHLLGTAEMRFRLIEDHRDIRLVRVMCEALSVSSSGYYAWRSRPDSPRKIANRALLVDIRRVHAQHRERYGAPRIYAQLCAEGQTVSRKRVERVMRQHGIRARTPRRYRVCTTDSKH